jgi:hypothetical protein
MANQITWKDFNMAANSQKILLHIDPELIVSLFSFIDRFELVFGETDREYTREAIGGDQAKYSIHPNGTFLEPGVEDESNNWGNRGSLLMTYRCLKYHMSAIEPIINLIFQQRRECRPQPTKEIECTSMPKIADEPGEL